MKAAVILCMIPLALAATFLPEPPSPYTGPQIPPAAQADTFRQRFEPAYPSHTFVERWWPGDASFAPEPLSFEQRWAPVEQTWGRRVRTIPIVKPPPGPSRRHWRPSLLRYRCRANGRLMRRRWRTCRGAHAPSRGRSGWRTSVPGTACTSRSPTEESHGAAGNDAREWCY